MLNLIHSSIDSALDYIQSETDFQTDDVITFDEVEGNYNDINENLDLMYSYINGNYSYYDVPSWIQSEAEWQGVSELELCNQYGEYCPETTINLSNFFNSPIDDLKSLFPQYNITEHQCYCIGSDFNDIGYDCPYLNWDATSWEEWKEGISDPTISGLFPDFSVDDMLQYFEIVCNQFDAYFSCE